MTYNTAIYTKLCRCSCFFERLDKLNKHNYRLVSVLMPLSKIFWKTFVYTNVLTFWIYSQQYLEKSVGYKCNHILNLYSQKLCPVVGLNWLFQSTGLKPLEIVGLKYGICNQTIVNQSYHLVIFRIWSNHGMARVLSAPFVVLFLI